MSSNLPHRLSLCYSVDSRLPVKVTRVGKQVPTACLQHREYFSFPLKASDWIYSKEPLPDDFLHKLVYDWKKNKS